MSHRLLVGLCAAPLLFGGIALAQTAGSTSGSANGTTAGATSGPAAGKNVEPDTAMQKKEGRSANEMQTPTTGGGAPGVEAKPGTESGAMPKSHMTPNDKSQ